MPSPLSARFSLQKLQKLSNFIPFSWTPGATAIASCIMSSSGSPSQNPDGFESVPLMSCAEDHAQCTTERGFVCRNKQLEKLKSRLSQETFTATSLPSVCHIVHAFSPTFSSVRYPLVVALVGQVLL
ncbi:hypothetical protein M404DRAFT_298731 [Pisolithus tinctorius Marx 270]|uniref:Uncharacterized protein n=1 Tax=Pisolithus tinctorius Marx 270 TaxID=870435 RepID=A0A0C3NJV3_PISTI|nr:hypothetical protein M404DRAFT_298731 [Pisolithus tinctorius Marx 270]